MPRGYDIWLKTYIDIASQGVSSAAASNSVSMIPFSANFRNHTPQVGEMEIYPTL